MTIRIFMILSYLSLILSCVNQNEKGQTIMKNTIEFRLDTDSISCIKIFKDEQEFEIRSREEINVCVKEINSSKVDYIKFSSKNKFFIYDLANNLLLEGFFRDNIFKVKGVSYKCENNLFLTDKATH